MEDFDKYIISKIKDKKSIGSIKIQRSKFNSFFAPKIIKRLKKKIFQNLYFL